jgi:cell division protein FtsA
MRRFAHFYIMKRPIAVGIDIGTYQIKVMVVEGSATGKEQPKVLGTGFTESRGLRHGYIVNHDDVSKSVATAVAQAQRASGEKIKSAAISIGGVGLASVISSSTLMISRADGEVSPQDVSAVIEQSRRDIPPAHITNRKILHTMPLAFRLDGKMVQTHRPAGLKGSKLEVKTLFITAMEQHFNDLIEAVEDAGVEVEQEVASPIAASVVTLTKAQKIAGVLLANIGAETVSAIIFEDGIPISLEVFPIGSNDITNDIALGLRIPLEEAEDVKRGNATPNLYPKKKLEDIVSARLSDIFELIEAHLKKIGKSGLLPAGIVLTGGGSGLTTIEDLARASLSLPSRTATLGVRSGVKDAFWSVAYGLCIMTLTGEFIGPVPEKRNFFETIIEATKKAGKSLMP